MNRFDRYSPSQYVPQVMPTPLDAGLLMQGLGQKQMAFDQTRAGIEGFVPEISYYHGDTEEARKIYQDFQGKTNAAIDSLMESGDVSAAQRELLKLNRDYLKRKQAGDIAFLGQRKEQYDRELKGLEKVKDAYSRKAFENWYVNNAHTEFSADQFNPLGSSIQADRPDISAKVSRAANLLKSDKFVMDGVGELKPLNDGSYYMSYFNGGYEIMTPQKAYNTIAGAIMNDPDIQQYAQAMYSIGEDIIPQISGMIDAAVQGASFQKHNVNVNFKSDKAGLHDYKNRTTLALQPGNPNLIVPGQTMRELESNIAGSQNTTERRIMEGYREMALEGFHATELGGNLRSQLDNIENLISTPLNTIDAITNSLEVVGYTDPTPEMIISDLNSMVFGSAPKIYFTDENGNNKELTKEEFINYYNDYRKVKDINHLYTTKLNEYMENGFESTPVQIVPSFAGDNKTKYIDRLKRSLNGNVYTFKDSEGNTLEGSDLTDKIAKMKASQIDITGINRYGEGFMPPTLEISVIEGSGNDAKAVPYTLIPNWNEQTQGFDIPDIVDDLMKIGNPKSPVDDAMHNALQEDRVYNAYGLTSVGNPNETFDDRYASMLGLEKIEQLGIKNLKPFANKDPKNGKKGNYVTYTDMSTGAELAVSYGDMLSSIETMLNIRNNSPEQLTQEQLKSNVDYNVVSKLIEEYGENSSFNFEELSAIDQYAVQKYLMNYLLPALKFQN